MSTWGDVRHFKHFLPRLLELAIEHRDDFLDLAVVFGKLSYARWQTWPPQEFEAAERFLNAYWEYQLNQDIDDPGDDAIDTVLCAEANARDSVQSLLDMWLTCDLLSARNHLAAFVLLNANYLLQKQTLWNAFWNRESKSHREVIGWLQSDGVSNYLSEKELTGGFEAARYQLEAIRSAFGPLSA
jgi:hypothetical protein